MNDKILKNIFDNLESSLKNEMRIRIQHNLEDGKYREYLVKRILSKIVPSKYEITNGFVIDSQNNKSDEMDIIKELIEIFNVSVDKSKVDEEVYMLQFLAGRNLLMLLQKCHVF